MSGFVDKTTDSLQKALDLLQVRQNITTANIANADTPGYKAKKVDFEDSLARALDLDGLRHLETTDPLHLPSDSGRLFNVEPDVYDNPEANLNNDGNTVDMEKEMAVLTENSIRYKTVTELIKKKLGALKYAISSGGGR